MSTKITAFRNRLRIDTVDREGVREELNNTNPFSWNGSATQFECGFFRKEKFVDDLSNLLEIVMEIKNSTDLNGTAIAARTVMAEDLNPALTETEWDDGGEEDCHVRFDFGSEEFNFDLGGNGSKQFWVVITAVRNDDERITLGCAFITIQEDGSSVTAPPNGGTNFRFNQGFPEFKFPDNSWHRWDAVFGEGFYVDDIVPAAAAASSDSISDHWRLNAGYPELKFPDDTWHQVNPLHSQNQYIYEIVQAASESFASNSDKFRISSGFPELKFPDDTWHRIDPIFDQGKYILSIRQTAS